VDLNALALGFYFLFGDPSRTTFDGKLEDLELPADFKGVVTFFPLRGNPKCLRVRFSPIHPEKPVCI